jgi:hypothetical protein
MITVEYPPGASDPVYRHNAQAFVYVLEGSIVMQVRGGKEVTLTPGQTFFESPSDVNVVGRNASQTKPRNAQCFWLRTKALPYCYRRTKSNTTRIGPTRGFASGLGAAVCPARGRIIQVSATVLSAVVRDRFLARRWPPS